MHRKVVDLQSHFIILKGLRIVFLFQLLLHTDHLFNSLVHLFHRLEGKLDKMEICTHLYEEETFLDFID